MFIKEAGTHKLNDVWLHCKSLPANFYSGKLLHVGDDSKTTNVRPIFKKYVRSEIKNHRSANLWNIFSKIYEKVAWKPN